MSRTLSIDEGKQFLKLCKAGRLFEIQKWIEAGNSISIPAELKSTPLDVAIDTGFHSLVELLSRHEPSQEVKNRALSRAVDHKRLDFIELLVAHGADITAIPFIDVLRAWDPKIIRYFIDRGADVITDSPFAKAFGEKIRTALRPWRECREKYSDFAPQLLEQANQALRHFCQREDLKWVSLLMWAGADPRSKGSTLDEEYFDESEFSTALDEAAYAKDVQILKRLKPDARRDDLDSLLVKAASFGRFATVQYLLDLGAKPNDKPHGGSTALEEALSSSLRFRSFGFSSYSSYGDHSKASRYAVSDTLDTARLLLEHGALWRSDDPGAVSLIRRNLFECEPDVTIELVGLLVKHEACSPDTIQDLLRTPAIKKHLIPVSWKLNRMGFDVRTAEQKVEEQRQKEAARRWAIEHLASKYDRGKIYKQIWSQPIQHVAKEYKVSDVYLIKVCKKLNIPRPGRGYWAKKAAGKPLKQPLLPKLPFEN